jgi:hypothetical protein
LTRWFHTGPHDKAKILITSLIFHFICQIISCLVIVQKKTLRLVHINKKIGNKRCRDHILIKKLDGTLAVGKWKYEDTMQQKMKTCMVAAKCKGGTDIATAAATNTCVASESFSACGSFGRGDRNYWNSVFLFFV